MNHDNDDTVPGQLENIRTELRFGAMRMDSIERRLEENTAITTQVKDLLEVQNTVRLGYKAARGLGNFVLWVGGIIVAIGAAWAYLKGWRP